ncbi:MAG: zinc metallopeptidase [Hyphomicrobiaceae bacterium]
MAEAGLAFILIILIGFVALAFLPQMWVKRVIAQHAADRPDIPGTGGQFARHLLDRLGLSQVGVEETSAGDHYDPDTKTVRLLKQNYAGRSLSAVVIAAHEVGHAMQDATGYSPLSTRTRLARQAARIQSIGAVIMLLAPVLLILAKSPAILLVEVVAGLMFLSLAIVIHAVTLPVEYDASFRRALPLLQAGQFLKAEDMPAARRILRAAALTYVAAAALSLLDVMRWMRMLRF